MDSKDFWSEYLCFTAYYQPNGKLRPECTGLGLPEWYSERMKEKQQRLDQMLNMTDEELLSTTDEKLLKDWNYERLNILRDRGLMPKGPLTRSMRKNFRA